MNEGKTGYVHVYTGDGKGKTTASIGLACRALGAGWNVVFAQFLKKGRFSEICALERFGPKITILQFGSGKFVRGRPDMEDINRARAGLEQIKAISFSGDCGLLIMDEINVAIKFGLLDIADVLGFLDSRPPSLEVVLTGRNAHDELIKAADIVTEFRMIRHYYEKGVEARRGIEM